ncbi:MAG: CopG family transcriptional regulator [Planctomycetes bacterium]|nr:CopG family transcriptional regulator [Planctomycetota bacterium]
MPLTRVQVQFTEAQSGALRRMAAAEGRSVADLVRESVDALVRARSRRSRAEVRERARGAAGRFRSGHGDLSADHDRYLREEFGR